MGPAHQDENREPGRKRLGRGINALLGEAPTSQENAAASPPTPSGPELTLIDRNMIDRSPFQPRTRFGSEALNELAESMRQHGVLQPLLVRPLGDRYQLIAGERRLIAAGMAELRAVPCRILDYDDQQVCEVALEENIKREDLHDLEKALAFQQYMTKYKMSIEQLSKRLSVNRTTISNLLRLLTLPMSIQRILIDDKISSGHARALLVLNEADQQSLCMKIIEEGWSVRQTEQAARAKQEPTTVPFQPKAKAPASPLSNHVLSLQNQLRDLTGTKVTIKQTGKDSGQVILHFESNDDFERILRALRRPAA
ncbi:MAG: ParB/RepB/Spo0J family partition protein [Planctomycetaceae bacterium]